MKGREDEIKSRKNYHFVSLSRYAKYRIATKPGTLEAGGCLFHSDCSLQITACPLQISTEKLLMSICTESSLMLSSVTPKRTDLGGRNKCFFNQPLVCLVVSISIANSFIIPFLFQYSIFITKATLYSSIYRTYIYWREFP